MKLGCGVAADLSDIGDIDFYKWLKKICYIDLGSDDDWEEEKLYWCRGWRFLKTSLLDIDGDDDWKQICDRWSCWLLDKKAALLTGSSAFSPIYTRDLWKVIEPNRKQILNKYVIDMAVDFWIKSSTFHWLLCIFQFLKYFVSLLSWSLIWYALQPGAFWAHNAKQTLIHSINCKRQIS